MAWLFPVAYVLSGLAGLVYEVSWTRLLTLFIGHTTAAASTVVAAFLGGLAIGALVGGRRAERLTPRASLSAYIVLELCVAALAFALPYELAALTPVIESAYRHGDPGWLFPLARIGACAVMVFVPALALGATFPLAVRWFASESSDPARVGGILYTANTIGAAAGALLAGFQLIPAIGLSGTTRVAIAATLTAALLVWMVRRTTPERPGGDALPAKAVKKTAPKPAAVAAPFVAPAWLAATVLAISGCASLTHEIVWIRVLSLVLGPTIYAFSATLAAVISGVALGSAAGTWIATRRRSVGAALVLTLLGAAMTTTGASVLVGDAIPRLVASQVADAPDLFSQLLRQGAFLTLLLIVPTAACFGAAFPLALALATPAGVGSSAPARAFGGIYAVNTVGAVLGSLLAGFVLIPRLGLQTTLALVSISVVAVSLLVVARGGLAARSRTVGTVLATLAALAVALAPAWDRDLLASGVYLYAPDVPKGLDREALLKAGSLLYYREGAAATVSVKRLTGTTTLAVDGKVDASNRRDMLTQKLIAHLPLLLHPHPQQVGIIGLGSGVTVGAALRHPIARADVIEISPEVVEASRFFAADNYDALADPRTHLIVGDGRSHLLLSQQKYNVIISEPSNPWIAGVAALFTREFFLGVKERLAPGGIVCQWAHTYNISDRDLRSIVATFHSVFPDGTMWLVGGDDVMLIAAAGPLDDRLAALAQASARPEVAADLQRASVRDAFSLLSLYAGGRAEIARYTAGAALLSDDQMSLEFSAPRQLHRPDAADNSAALQALLDPEQAPAAVREARRAAGPKEWRNRALMLSRSDVHAMAYDDFVRALQGDVFNQAALDGLVLTARLLKRAPDALSWLKSLTADKPARVPTLVAISQLQAAAQLPAEALATANEAAALQPPQPAALEQVAALQADSGASAALDATVTRLRALAPERAATSYFSALAAFLRQQPAEAVKDAERAAAIDPDYAAVYDLLGAAQTKLGHAAEARQAFEQSLRKNPHDSTAYANLGILELQAGNRAAAANYFAEALWLEPGSPVARQGLNEAR